MNVALEQSLGRAQTFNLPFIGAADKRMLATEAITMPNPKYASPTLIGGTGTLSYNALQAQFQRQLSNGLQALVSYSWSHAIDGSFGDFANASNVNANRRDSDYNLRNVFSAAVTYNFPVLKRSNLTHAITGGWFADNIVQIRSGPLVDEDWTFAVLCYVNAAVLIRPDIIPGQPFYLYGFDILEAKP